MFFGLPIVAYDLTEHRVSAQDAAVYAGSDTEHALADAVNSLGVPIATGERLHTLYQCRELFEFQAADILQVDISHFGGIKWVRAVGRQLKRKRRS